MNLYVCVILNKRRAHTHTHYARLSALLQRTVVGCLYLLLLCVQDVLPRPRSRHLLVFPWNTILCI